MKPFVTENRSAPRAVWVVAAVAAAGYFVWQFQLVAVTEPPGTEGMDRIVAEPVSDPSWDAIVDHHGADAASDSVGRDPLLDAIQDSDVDPSLAVESDAGAGSGSADEGLMFDLSEPPPPTASDVIPAAAEMSASGGLTTASYETRSELRGDSDEPIPAELAARLRHIDELGSKQYYLEAHAALSQIYWKQPEYRAVIRDRIEFTAKRIYDSPDHVTEPYFVEFGETLEGIAAEHDVPWQYLARLNRIAPRALQAGQQLKVVRGPFGAIVDLDRFSLTIHTNGWYVRRYPIGTGRDDRTPVGEFTVENKVVNPTWYNPDGGVVDADDPANPLGEFWLGLGNHIGIHGTIDPQTIGRAASRGCIHLGDGDIDEVFRFLDVGSEVIIRR